MLAGKKRSRKADGGADADSAKRKKKTKGGAVSLGGGRPKSSTNNSTKFPNPTSLLDSESIDCLASPHGRTSQPVRTPVLSADDRDILIDRLRKEVIDKFGFTLSRRAERGRAADASGGGSGGGVTFTMGSGGIKMVVEGDEDSNKEDKKEEKGMKKKKKKRPRPSPADREPTLADLVVKRRLVVGINQCTRALEAAAANNNTSKKNCTPSLVLLSRDVRPPTILAHVPIMCRQMGIPAVVLPGRASVELGKAVGGRSVAVALFLPRSTGDKEEEEKKLSSNGGPSESQIQECHRRIDSYVKFALSKVPSGGGRSNK